MATVEIVGILRDYVKRSPDDLGALDGLSVSDLIQKIGVPADLVAFVMVNGEQRPKTYTLQAGDQIKLIPFVGGG